MIKNATRLLFCLAVLSFSGAVTLLQAQTTTVVQAVPFYRFRVSDTNLGYLYTASFQEGINAGFIPDGVLHNPSGIIGYIVVPPTQDSIPVDGQGLQPLHRWRVIESGRAYWYLSPFYGTHGSNYTYEGIAGYTYNLYDTTRPGLVFTAYYSQRYGYWFALDGERVPDAVYFSPYLPPPGDCQFIYYDFATGLYICSSFNNHGSICKLLQNPGGFFTFTTPPPPPPPPPPGECNVGDGIKAKCSQLGGTWSDETCSCEY